jgi:hypothetical protein
MSAAGFVHDVAQTQHHFRALRLLHSDLRFLPSL